MRAQALLAAFGAAGLGQAQSLGGGLDGQPTVQRARRVLVSFSQQVGGMTRAAFVTHLRNAGVVPTRLQARALVDAADVTTVQGGGFRLAFHEVRTPNGWHPHPVLTTPQEVRDAWQALQGGQ